MKTIYVTFISLLLSGVLYAESVNTKDFVPSNSYVVFENSSDAPSVTLTFTNKTGADVDVNSLSLVGTLSDEFNITNDGCSVTTLSDSESCNVEVKFIPNNDGMKSALLKVPYLSDSEAQYVFLTNFEDTRHNVIKRLAPVVYDVNISEQLDANSSYTLQWSLIGYSKNYQTDIVMFDCTGIDAGECGASYTSSEKFLESPLLSPMAVESVDWTYHDQNATRFNYSYTATMPETRANGDAWDSNGTDIVLRFYVISEEDQANHESTLSLIIPGNLSDKYYDTSGRKIEKVVCPEGGCE
jgi:hypothetical protein